LRAISAFARVFDALVERVGVRGLLLIAYIAPSPRRAKRAATLSRKGRG
jgi:hypothetical protein